MRKKQFLLEDQLDAIYRNELIQSYHHKNNDNITDSTALWNTVDATEEVTNIRKQLLALKEEISRKLYDYDNKFHPKWVCYACIYIYSLNIHYNYDACYFTFLW